jgi:hypothetical protein
MKQTGLKTDLKLHLSESLMKKILYKDTHDY